MALAPNVIVAEYNGLFHVESKVIELLARAIPREELVALEERRRASEANSSSCYTENDGIVYYDCLMQDISAVASWNNSRPSEKEIIEWFEQALLLA